MLRGLHLLLLDYVLRTLFSVNAILLHEAEIKLANVRQ